MGYEIRKAQKIMAICVLYLRVYVTFPELLLPQVGKGLSTELKWPQPGM